MSQVSYGTITITDTNDIESIYMIYKGGDNNETPPSITWTGGQVDWTTDITTVEGNYIWAITVYKKSGIAITADNYQEFFGDPICLTGSTGRSVRSINTYYCNYGEGRPDETYNGWSGAIPDYDENKPNYWVKTVITYVDSTEEVIEASGVVANFNTEDKETSFRSLVADIDPIQDLNGYDKPWAGGAGRNLLNVGGRVNQTSAEVKYTSDDNYIILNGTKNGGGYATMANLTLTLPAGTYYAKAFVISGTTTGTIDVYVNNGTADITGSLIGSSERTITLESETTLRFRFAVWSDGTVLTNYTVGIVVSKTSGIDKFYPYSNICPISGHTECVTSVSGVNVWDEEWEVGKIGSDGQNATDNTRIRSKNYIPVVPNQTYYFMNSAGSSNGHYVAVYFYDADKNYVNYISNGKTNFTFTIPSDCMFMRFTLFSWYGSTYNHDISINYPSTDHDYHAYNGTTYTTSLGRTVYGGTLDVVTGELTIDRAMVDLGDLTWGYDTAWGHLPTFWARFAMKAVANGEIANMVCSQYATVSANALYAGADGSIANNGQYIRVTDSRFTDATAFTSAVNGVQLVYELATPQTIQLTPQEVRTLLGTNNVWADSGEVSVSVFTIVGQDITIYKDNAITKAIHDSVEANAKATEALDKATAVEQLVTQVDTLLGGHFLWHGSALSTLTKAGARVVEQVTSGTTDVSGNPSQWHHNVNIGANGIQLRYNEAVMAQLAATNSSSSNDIALKFYQPPTISGSTTTQGNLTMALKGNALTFYDPTVANGQSVQATLDANGLKLLKGGVEAGTKNTNDYIYVYSTDDATNHTFNINSSGDKSDWRIVAGQKFGVDKAGNLYANNATISGAITVQAGSNVYNKTEADGAFDTKGAAADASYSVAIEVTSIDYTANTATLVATPFYQGGDIPSGITLTYTWYKDSVANANIVGSNSNTLNVTNTTAMGLNRVYICVISK